MKLLIKSLSISPSAEFSPERLLPDRAMLTLDALRPASQKPAPRKNRIRHNSSISTPIDTG